jgi:hypothetical protein
MTMIRSFPPTPGPLGPVVAASAVGDEVFALARKLLFGGDS